MYNFNLMLLSVVLDFSAIPLYCCKDSISSGIIKCGNFALGLSCFSKSKISLWSRIVAESSHSLLPDDHSVRYVVTSSFSCLARIHLIQSSYSTFSILNADVTGGAVLAPTCIELLSSLIRVASTNTDASVAVSLVSSCHAGSLAVQQTILEMCTVCSHLFPWCIT